MTVPTDPTLRQQLAQRPALNSDDVEELIALINCFATKLSAAEFYELTDESAVGPVKPFHNIGELRATLAALRRIVPDPKMAAASLAACRGGDYVTAEQYIADRRPVAQEDVAAVEKLVEWNWFGPWSALNFRSEQAKVKPAWSRIKASLPQVERLKAAAAEVERLKADNESLNALLRERGIGQGEIDTSATEWQELKAEVERLKAAIDSKGADLGNAHAEVERLTKDRDEARAENECYLRHHDWNLFQADIARAQRAEALIERLAVALKGNRYRIRPGMNHPQCICCGRHQGTACRKECSIAAALAEYEKFQGQWKEKSDA